ncbi:MAG: 50S ribosomal protein L25 [Candidatus Pacebacteria bacterium]|nr:50S ribosomal protein L25 [Candidatus Paceibacterota bacterium]MBP9715770.1 50S ribosomal protein L25 [Candidatus Paceibacterota bacterium]
MKTLNATKRSKAEKLAIVRSNGMVPAVVYGAKVDNTSISVPSIDFIKVWKGAGESSTLVLSLEGKNIDVLIHEVQVDPIKGFPKHVDFLAVDMNKPIEVAVPLEFTGVAPAEKAGLGSLVKVIHEVEISALPKDIPAHITVDISTLETLENQIHVSDLVLPAGVTMISDTEEVVALVAAAKEEVESAPVDLSSIEVEKKGKKEEEAAAE